MKIRNKTKDWEKEVYLFTSTLQKIKGLMFKRTINKPALFLFENKEKSISIWNFAIFQPLIVISLDENKSVKEKKKLREFPFLQILKFKDTKCLIEDSLKEEKKYEIEDKIEFEEPKQIIK